MPSIAFISGTDILHYFFESKQVCSCRWGYRNLALKGSQTVTTKLVQIISKLC
jgi:hypothetical protein